MSDDDNRTPRAGLRHNSFAHPRGDDPSTSTSLQNSKGSGPDVLRILSDTSIALSKADDLTPKSALINDTRFRNLEYENDDNDADDEKEEFKASRHALPSGDEEIGDSDKENTPSADRDDAGLHQRLQGVTLGAKRGLDEGVENREIVKEEEAGEKAPQLQMTIEGVKETVSFEEATKALEKEDARVKRVKASPEKK